MCSSIQNPELSAGLQIGNDPVASAQLAYVSGRYVETIKNLETLAHDPRIRRRRRVSALRTLSLAYFQTGQFAAGAQLPLRDPLTGRMRQFPTLPNRLSAAARLQRTTLPFLQSERWQLPVVDVTANGMPLRAKIDTGGDLFSLPWSEAERLGIDALITSTGWFAGGRRSRTGFGRLEQLQLGHLVIADVPISINNFDHPVIGTGLLRQFRPTLDYPGGTLVLNPRVGRGVSSGIPFWLVHTHLMVARGSLDGTRLNFLVDSGLEVDNGASFAAPESTLEQAGISIPGRKPTEGSSGAGVTSLRMGEFPIASIGLGGTLRHRERGLTGVFPRQLTRPLPPGIPLHGIISHNFLRHYRWTIDFDQMLMELAS